MHILNISRTLAIDNLKNILGNYYKIIIDEYEGKKNVLLNKIEIKGDRKTYLVDIRE